MYEQDYPNISKAERIIVLGSVRKKYLTRQILRSKDYLYTV